MGGGCDGVRRVTARAAAVKAVVAWEAEAWTTACGIGGLQTCGGEGDGGD